MVIGNLIHKLTTIASASVQSCVFKQYISGEYVYMYACMRLCIGSKHLFLKKMRLQFLRSEGTTIKRPVTSQHRDHYKNDYSLVIILHITIFFFLFQVLIIYLTIADKQLSRTRSLWEYTSELIMRIQLNRILCIA